MNLFYTDDRPETGWTLLKLDDGTWRAEQIAGPRALTANNVGGLIQQLAGDDDALRRRYTESQIRQAATAIACNPDTLATQLRSLPA